MEENLEKIEKQQTETQEEVKSDFEEHELKEAEHEIFSSQKIVTYPQLGTIVIKFPTIKEEMDINRFYSKKFTELLKNTELVTSKKMTQILRDKGEWTEEEDNNLIDLMRLYFSKTVTLKEIENKKRKSQTDKENINELNKEIGKIYNEYLELSIFKGALFENTVDKKAEEEAFKYKMFKCCYRENGSLVWESLENLLNYNAISEFEQLMADCMSFWKGTSVPLLESLLAHQNGNSATE